MLNNLNTTLKTITKKTCLIKSTNILAGNQDNSV